MFDMTIINKSLIESTTSIEDETPPIPLFAAPSTYARTQNLILPGSIEQSLQQMAIKENDINDSMQSSLHSLLGVSKTVEPAIIPMTAVSSNETEMTALAIYDGVYRSYERGGKVVDAKKETTSWLRAACTAAARNSSGMEQRIGNYNYTVHGPEGFGMMEENLIYAMLTVASRTGALTFEIAPSDVLEFCGLVNSTMQRRRVLEAMRRLALTRFMVADPKRGKFQCFSFTNGGEILVSSEKIRTSLDSSLLNLFKKPAYPLQIEQRKHLNKHRSEDPVRVFSYLQEFSSFREGRDVTLSLSALVESCRCNPNFWSRNSKIAEFIKVFAEIGVILVKKLGKSEFVFHLEHP